MFAYLVLGERPFEKEIIVGLFTEGFFLSVIQEAYFQGRPYFSGALLPHFMV